MATPGPPEQARFFVGVLAAGLREVRLAGDALAERFGPPDLASPAMAFTSTEYYRDELGPAPLRVFFTFPGLFYPGGLAGVKLTTNTMEEELAARSGGDLPRPVNLDPGYVTPAKLVLASAKNFSHRIYIGSGVYAEITLHYRKGAFHAFPWTFPDYRSGRYDAFFLEVRKRIGT